MPSLVHVRTAVGLLVASLVFPGCAGNDGGPSAPSSAASVVISSSAPASGSTLAPGGTPPGAFFQRGTGTFGVTISVTATQQLSFAQLAVFLLTSDDAVYCGQNLPDWPTWRPFAAGQTVTYTV